MPKPDKCCTIVPYFKVPPARMEEFKKLCERFLARTQDEPRVLYYGFSFHEDMAHCREGYADAEGALAHLESVGPLIEEALKIASLERLEIHGPEEELSKMREPLAQLNPEFYVLEFGFRR